MNTCFSIYHTSWTTSSPKSNYICDNIPTKAILFFLGCSEVNSTWLITSELANQRARKVLFTCVVYTNEQLFTEVEVNSGGYLPSREAARLIIVLVNNCFSIYHTSWITFRPIARKQINLMDYNIFPETKSNILFPSESQSKFQNYLRQKTYFLTQNVQSLFSLKFKNDLCLVKWLKTTSFELPELQSSLTSKKNSGGTKIHLAT